MPGAGAGDWAGHRSAWKWADTAAKAAKEAKEAKEEKEAEEATEAKEAGPGIAGAEESGDVPALAGCVLEYLSRYLLRVLPGR